MRSFILGIAVVSSVGFACGGGVAGGRPPADGGRDTAPDAGDAPRAPGVTCPPVAAGEKRDLGACCAAAGDCLGNVCWNGFCTKVCAAAADCGQVTAPSPLPVGTAMACAPNLLGDPFSYCLPGSLQDCTTGGATCPAGEACALGLNPAATAAGAASTVYLGMCLTRMMADDYLPAGSACLPEAGPYACENQGGYLGSGCLAGRCTRACARSNDCPIGTQCQVPPHSAKLGGAVSFLSPVGPGVCLGRFCGQVPGAAAVGEVGQQGADVLCAVGDVCVPTMAVGASGGTQYLSCVPPRPDALPFGAPCSRDPAQSLRCAHDSLCAERGAARFCSRLCRVDGDCPPDAFCLDDYAAAPLPNGSAAQLGMCTPRALLPGAVCQSEKTCASNERCAPLGGRSNQMICRPATGTKGVGQPCAAAAECRSGECVDRDFRPPTGANRTTCSATCTKNSECGAGQICFRVVRNNNGTTDDPRDDIVTGACLTLAAPPLAGGCATNDNCTGQISIDERGGDSCDPTHRTCYTAAARIGDACMYRGDCPLGAYCHLKDPGYPGGVCLSQGCDPAAVTGADACPEGSICILRAETPLHACYPACTGGSCARAAEGFRCEAASPSTPANRICIFPGGT